MKGFKKKYLKESEKQLVMSLKLNDTEKDWLMKGAKTLRQAKLSTAIKQLAYIGYTKVVLDKETNNILDFIFENSRRNDRMGIVDVEQEFMQK